MFSSVTQADLRAQMEQHLLMVQEVLGLDQFVQAWSGALPASKKVWAWSQRAFLRQAGWLICGA